MSLADEDEIDLQEIERSKIRESKQTVNVRQSETGQLDGWDQFMELLGDESSKSGPNLVNPDDIGKAYDNAMKRIKPGDYTLLKVSDGIFSLQKRDGTQYEVILTGSGEDVEFRGLPEEFEKNMQSFTPQEKKENPWLCIHSVLRAAESVGTTNVAQANNSSTALLGEPTPSEGWELKQQNPSAWYDIVKRIAVGGFARVFEVRRKSDGQICALKYVEV